MTGPETPNTGETALPALAGPAGSDLLEDLESMARQHCYTDQKQKDGVTEINTTDSGALSTDAEALRTLARHGRFRIIRERGRMVVGYWPENDPNAGTERPARQPEA